MNSLVYCRRILVSVTTEYIVLYAKLPSKRFLQNEIYINGHNNGHYVVFYRRIISLISYIILSHRYAYAFLRCACVIFFQVYIKSMQMTNVWIWWKTKSKSRYNQSERMKEMWNVMQIFIWPYLVVLFVITLYYVKRDTVVSLERKNDPGLRCMKRKRPKRKDGKRWACDAFSSSLTFAILCDSLDGLSEVRCVNDWNTNY